MIEDRFHYREICDDDKMERFFQRTLDTVRDRYRQILRMETIKFDPMVNKYFEGEYTTNGTDNSETARNILNVKDYRKSDSSESNYAEEVSNEFEVKKDTTSTEGSGTKEGSFSNTGSESKTGNNTIIGTSNAQHNNSTSESTTSHTDDVTTTTGSSGEINHKAIKQAPMNASGVTTNGTAGVADQSSINGALNNLNFSYATAYDANDKTGKTYNHNDEDIDNTSTTTGTDAGSSSESSRNSHTVNEGINRSDGGSNDETNEYEETVNKEYEDARSIGTTGSDRMSGNTTGKDTFTGTDSVTKDGSSYQIKHDRYTGRDGVLPQDALKAAMNYLQNYSTAFEWLCNKLEINFIGIYDI